MFSFDLICTPPNILHKILPHAHHICLHHFMNPHSKTLKHTHTHIKSHLTPIIHLFTSTYYYNHTYSVISAPSLNFHKKTFIASFIENNHATSHFPLICLVGYPQLVSHPGFGAVHPVTHGLTGNLNIPGSSHWDVLF